MYKLQSDLKEEHRGAWWRSNVSLHHCDKRTRQKRCKQLFSQRWRGCHKNPSVSMCVLACVWESERERVLVCVWVGQWWMRRALVSPPTLTPPTKFAAAYLSLPSMGQGSHHRIKPHFISVLQNKMVPLKLHKISFSHWILSSSQWSFSARVRESWMENLQINVLLDPCCLLCCPEPLWYIISHYHWRPPALTVIFPSDIKLHMVISVHP